MSREDPVNKSTTANLLASQISKKNQNKTVINFNRI
jgi:hypothetical protein